MREAAVVAIAIVALLHVYFMVMEMFLWTKPAGLKAFGLTAEQAASSKVLAANQGLYNGFLAAGLVFGHFLGHDGGFHVTIFFLSCIIVAGIYGGITANRKIFFVQALPAFVALVLLHLR